MQQIFLSSLSRQLNKLIKPAIIDGLIAYDANISKSQIGNGKDYQWRSTETGSHLLINGASGYAVAGMGKSENQWHDYHKAKNPGYTTSSKRADKARLNAEEQKVYSFYSKFPTSGLKNMVKAYQAKKDLKPEETKKVRALVAVLRERKIKVPGIERLG